MLTALRDFTARIGRWPRLVAVGICLLLAAASALGSGRPKPAAEPGVAVVVAARALPTGHRLVAADLVVSRWPAALRPNGARGDPRAFVGTRLAAPIAAREALTLARVLGPGLTDSLPAATVATVVTVEQDVGLLVRSGERVDLYAALRDELAGDSRSAPKAREVARGLLVLAATSATGPDGGPGTSLVLAADRVTALRIAQFRLVWAFSVVADSP